MDLVAETLLQFLWGCVWWVVLFPVVWVAAAPFIVVAGLFRRAPYFTSVRRMFSGVTWFWVEHGVLFTP
jgi:hypothetical protein